MTSAALPAVDPAFELAIKPRPTAEASRRLREHRRRRAQVFAADAAALAAVAAVMTALLWSSPGTRPASLAAAAVVVAALVLVLLSTFRTRERGLPARREYRRVALAGAVAFATGACWAAFAPSTSVRLALLAVVPAGTAAVVAGRMAWRNRPSARGSQSAPRTVVVGPQRVLEALVPSLAAGHLGYNVVATTLTETDAESVCRTVGAAPVLGTAAATADVARATNAEIVLVAGTSHDPDFVRRLSWQLEGSAASLVLATPLTDVAAGRMSVRTAAGLALVDVRIPTYDGASHRVKRVLDVVCSLFALVPIVLIAPLVAVAIRVDSSGPVIFRQRRVGCDGREFEMLKFRTMRAGAEHEVEQLADSNEASGVLFKVRRDPRVTRVGRFLRTYSIDELPQFWNVLRGDMSIVGPRPPLPQEVRSYDVPVFRRLYLRPGITGPWQIGGRSDLSWEESVRLDLHYVENWSVARDLAIMVRTAAVVLRAKGAY